MLNKIKKFLHLSKEECEETSIAPQSPADQINELFDELKCDVIRVELGEDFCQFGECLCEENAILRKELMETTGFILPAVHILSNDNLQENECKILVKEKVVFDDFLLPRKEELINHVTSKLKELTKTHLDEIFTNELAERYIDAVWRNNYRLVTILGYVLTPMNIKEILVELLQNGKSIKNIDYVFEKIAQVVKPEEFPCHLKDTYVIAQRVCNVY